MVSILLENNHPRTNDVYIRLKSGLDENSSDSSDSDSTDESENVAGINSTEIIERNFDVLGGLDNVNDTDDDQELEVNCSDLDWVSFDETPPRILGGRRGPRTQGGTRTGSYRVG